MGSPSITLQASIKSINNMAEGKSGSFSRVVRKKAGRAKEKFLQNFGKADKTTDELFEVYQANFARQRASGTRLQKELQNYATCMRALQAANKGLMDCLTEIYEPEWPGHEQIPVKAATLDLIWDDLCHKLNDQVTIPLSTYLSQFSEIRNKIDKRGRKLVDYDCARHAVESLQRGSGKKDDIKIAKSREQMEEAKRLYEVLNKELHDELPALYDSRIPFMISTLQTLFDSETTFHCEYSKTHAQLRELIDTFALEAQKGSYHTSARHLSVPSAGSGLRTSDSNVRSYEELENKYSTEPSQRGNMSVNKVIVSSNQSNGNSVHHTSGDIRESNDEHSADGVKYLNSETSNDLETSGTQKSEATIVIPPGATTTDLPPGVIYRVRAIYKYIAEDSDELSFEEGEVIRVIEYEDPEEAEDGWLMGIKESTSEKGLFPANFTKAI